MSYSVVIPVFNECDSLRQLYKELKHVATAEGLELQVVFVDDGSSDPSWTAIQELAAQDPLVTGIRLRRNFGKAAALDAGISASNGSVIFTMDADLQDDPREIPKFIAKLEVADVVSGWKKVRHDPWHKVWPSRVFNNLVSFLTGVRLHDHNCGFKCYRSEIFHEIRLYGDLHRFVPVLASARGWRIAEVVVEHRPRKHGASKYGLKRIPKGFLDLMTVKFLTGYGQRPQHMLGMLGLASFGFGAIGMTILTGGWFLSRIIDDWQPIHLHERAIFFYSLAALILGAQFVTVGFLAELITSRQNSEERPYSIAEVANAGTGAHEFGVKSP